MDTPLVQRLRQIHQMGATRFTYPSTTHSRFEHTLGVMLQIAKLPAALSESQSEERIESGDINDMRLAALLHDVGHGIFSHTSEEIYGNLPVFDILRKQHGLEGSPHEILSHLIITSAPFGRFAEEAAELHQVHIPVDEIANYVVKKSANPRRPYKMALLNGPFDADKLDYLFRDSHFSGLPISVDLDRLFYTVRIINANGQQTLGVTHTGATPLEQILFSKMVLFTSVYHHHKVRTCDCMFGGIIEYMREHEISFTIRGKDLTLESPVDFLWLTDNELLSFGFRTNDDDLHDLIHNLFFRRLLKRALIISSKTVEQTDDDRWDELQRHAKESPESWRERRKLALAIWERAGRPCLPQEVWVDLPELPSVESADETFVLPAEFGRVTPVTLNDIFPTSKWAHQYGLHKWRGHVFCPPHLRQPIGKAAKEIIEDRYGVTVKDEAFLWCKCDPPA
jgi:HD superfamily phosphohydrolase